jgi:hypothetical protein
MNNRHPIDRELLIPILLGGLSVVGIAVVLIVGRALNAPAEIDATPSATPFQYVFLGTEPAITTLVVEGSETLPPLADTAEVEPFPSAASSPFSTPILITPRPRTATSGAPGTPRTGTATRAVTPTSTRTTTPSTANTYDDTDSRLTYSGSWTAQLGVSGAYQDSLHISNTVENSVTFTFTGTEVHVFYQAGPSLGTMTITVDSFGDAPISQAQNTTQIKEWVSDILSSGTHTVVIQHNSGGSINIDRIYIPASTPTPTRTPTP